VEVENRPALLRVVTLDAGFARSRAETLSERRCGDPTTAADPERHGLSPELVSETVAALQVESGSAAGRIRPCGGHRGAPDPTPITLRAPASRGFNEASLNVLIAQVAREAIG
jgi:hypothetical protein